MMTTHTVKQGEHLSQIAARYGFHDRDAIWNHPQNADLRGKRKNPNVLFPGDQLFIPDKEQRAEARPTERRHRFKVKTERLMLRLVLEDAYEKPIASARCELRVDDEVFKLTTDQRGELQQEIKPAAQNAYLTIRDAQTPVHEVVIPLHIGHLDPVDEVPGQTKRLNNLGYRAGPRQDASEAENRALLVSAVEEFQCDQGLPVDGKCGPLTQAKLKQVHGC
jgi:Putative peptidoglycan binding domain/LysM domain